MGIKTTINSSGVNQTSGRGTSIAPDTNNDGFLPFTNSPSAITSNTTIADGMGGIYTISGSTGTGILTVTLPVAANSPMAMFVFRTTSADRHVITASQETAGVKAICTLSGTVTSSIGASALNYSGQNSSRFEFGATLGSSVTMMCDGKSFLILGGSGSFILPQN